LRSCSKAPAWEAADAETRAGMPDPAKVRMRVYVTQSTHKTLTSLRQGSMIHVFDQAWGGTEHAFHDAFMTHTSTSPNYQILASLDVGRRQCELEGFELVQKQIELAMVLREKITAHPRLSRWFRFLTSRDMIPENFRPSGLDAYYDAQDGWVPMERAWVEDEFVLDPTRLTLFIGKTGIDGDTFRRDELAARYGIQVNKTSRNTVLFMTNIGTTRSSVAHLIEVLARMSVRLDEDHEDDGPAERAAWEESVAGLTERLPPLPDFSRFHAAFRPGGADGTPEGDLRTAFMLSADEGRCEYLPLERLAELTHAGGEPVSSAFVTPYPPGFPILVPGQVVSEEIIEYMLALDTKEIHGYRPELGLRLFTKQALEAVKRGARA
jgi:arginine decarboxylase